MTQLFNDIFVPVLSCRQQRRQRVFAVNEAGRWQYRPWWGGHGIAERHFQLTKQFFCPSKCDEINAKNCGKFSTNEISEAKTFFFFGKKSISSLHVEMSPLSPPIWYQLIPSVGLAWTHPSGVPCVSGIFIDHVMSLMKS